MQAWGMTDTGNVRRMNQDAYQILLLKTGQLLVVVADGMGGAKSGNIASTMAIDVFTRDVQKHAKANMTRLEMDRVMTSAADQANREVYDRYLLRCGDRGCEYSFINLYLWGRQQAAFLENHLIFFL